MLETAYILPLFTALHLKPAQTAKQNLIHNLPCTQRCSLTTQR